MEISGANQISAVDGEDETAASNCHEETPIVHLSGFFRFESALLLATSSATSGRFDKPLTLSHPEEMEWRADDRYHDDDDEEDEKGEERVEESGEEERNWESETRR